MTSSASQVGLVSTETKPEEKVFRVERRRASVAEGRKQVHILDLYSDNAEEAVKLAEAVVFGWYWLDTVTDEPVEADSVSYKCVGEIAEKNAIKPKRIRSTITTVVVTVKKD